VAVTYLHGVETIELDDGIVPVQTVKSSIIGVIGTAPDADPDLFPLNTPVALFANPTKATKLGKAGTLLDAVNAIYSQGSATVVVIRVEGETGREAMANAVGSPTAKTGVWALLKSRPILKLIPKILIAPGLTSERPSDGLVDATVGAPGDGYVQATTKVVFDPPAAGGRQAQGTVQVVLGKVTGVTITDPGYGYAAAPAATVTGDGTGATVTTSLGFVANPVAKALEAVAPRLRAIALVDGPGTSYEDAVSYRNDFGSQRVMVLDPGVVVYDIETATNVTKPASAYAAGIQARIDKENGFWWSFSNNEIQNILGPARPVDFMYGDPDAEANQLNGQQITTIIHDDGFRFWGLRGTGQDALWAFLSVRRTADMIYESLEAAHRPFLDRPFNYALLDVIENSVNAYLQQLRARGALINGTCTIDPNVNTKDTFVNGELIVDFDLEPPAPLEHLTFRARRNPNYYTDFIEEFVAATQG
jgi:hypothetical protein